MSRNHRPDAETFFLRRELVENYHRRGLPIPQMIRLLDEHHLLDPTQNYNARYSLVVRLLRSLKKEDRKRFQVLQEESDQALIEYIARQEYLYQRATEDGDWRLASEISQTIARACGVDTDRPVRVEVDILSAMQAAFAKAQKRLAQKETPKAIEITPQHCLTMGRMSKGES